MFELRKPSRTVSAKIIFEFIKISDLQVNLKAAAVKEGTTNWEEHLTCDVHPRPMESREHLS